MKVTKSFKRFTLELFTGIFVISNIVPVGIVGASDYSDKIVNPLKEVSTLDCRFTEFDELSSKCKQKLPELNTKDYSKFIKQNGGYNDYTRFYTVLWGASYKYGWDVGFGGHQGTDIVTSKGTPVYSMSKGKVIVAKKALGWGNVVTVEHLIRGKKVFSNYAHLSKISVKVGDKVNAGEKVGEVGSTGNSTGNHLHFQIDLDTPFHPYYYDNVKCPYSYSKISEEGVCFDELKVNSIDPLLFLQTNGSILDNLKTPTIKVEKVTNPTKVYDSNKNYDTDGVENGKTYNDDKSIFEKTVYIGYPVNDIKEVQRLLRKLDLYDGKITGDYSDIENIIYKYQISKSIVQNKSSNGAGWFGPKTRSTLKIDYDKYQKGSNVKVTIKVTNKTSKTTVDNGIATQKIERTHILTREEIEAREYEGFIKANEFNLNLNNLGGNIKIGQSSKIDLSITKKYRDKAYKGNTPLDISIATDESILKVFPKKMYNFPKGKREITLTGLKSGVTNVSIKFGSQTIKTYKIRVYGENEKIYLESGMIYGKSKVVFGDQEHGIALFEDKSKKRLINVEYSGTYKLKGVGDTKVCIKKGSVKTLSKIHKRSCSVSELKDEIEFTYSDTVAGILLFDYKSTGSNAKVEIINTYNNESLADKKLVVSNPKGLKNTYVYKDDVINVLKNDIATNQTSGYFQEDKAISEFDSKVWLTNTLKQVKSNTYDTNLKNKIDIKLSILAGEGGSKYKTLTRKEFLEKAYNLLVFDNNNTNYKSYKDLDDDLNKKAYALFGKNITWKDKFGENYFQPKKDITRGEVAFILNNTLSANSSTYLSVK